MDSSPIHLSESDLIRLKGIHAAHAEVEDAFKRQVTWRIYVPILGIPTIIRRNKLLRISEYLCDEGSRLCNRPLVPRLPWWVRHF